MRYETLKLVPDWCTMIAAMQSSAIFINLFPSYAA